MIYILGGASRSGKTLLSRRAVSEKLIPYFPLDALFNSLANGAPQLGITYNQPFVERAEKMWPVAKPLFKFFSDEEQSFLVEGDSVLPSQVAELIHEGIQVRSCFVGYAGLTKEEKLAHIRKHHQGDRDWTRGISDEKLLVDVEEMIQFSKYLKEECAKFGIEYFDISHDFDGPRESAFSHLFV